MLPLPSAARTPLTKNVGVDCTFSAPPSATSRRISGSFFAYSRRPVRDAERFLRVLLDRLSGRRPALYAELDEVLLVVEEPRAHLVALAAIARQANSGGRRARALVTVNGLRHVEVALRVPRPVLDDVLHRPRRLLLKLVEDRLVELMRRLARRAQPVVELHDDDLGAIGRNSEIDARLLPPRVRKPLLDVRRRRRRLGGRGASALRAGRTRPPWRHPRCRGKPPSGTADAPSPRAGR